MKVKVCGLKHPNQTNSLSTLVDYVGFIYYEKSPRHVITASPSAGKANRVGVFVNHNLEFILARIKSDQLHAVQLHGDETPEFCTELKKHAQVIKAFGIDHSFDFNTLIAYEKCVTHFLFDTKSVNRGGSGKSYDWNILEQYTGETSFFLSGGIGLDSINAIRKFNHPQLHAIDINSRFEITPADKNIQSIQTFIHELNK